MPPPSWQPAYDAERSLAARPFRSACYAPFVSMYFDSLGNVRACCQNVEQVLGSVTRQRLSEIWRGRPANELRQALERYEFDRGCKFCHWQLADGSATKAYALKYDRLPLLGDRGDWPTQMEFSLTNVCNLECAMCNGEWSSAIRSRREKLPPLPRVYTDEFFDDLRAFLPHLVQAHFLGGEPWLMAENFRIWDLMRAEGLSTHCHVTTNGTQYGARVEQVLESLPVSISVSLDAVTPTVYESIRHGARWNEVLANLGRFRDYTRSRGTYLGLAYCLMRTNYREFAPLLRFADEWDLEVVLNTVTDPPAFSLYTLSSEELTAAVHELRAAEGPLLATLRRNREVWQAAIDSLENRLAHAAGERRYFQGQMAIDAFAPQPPPEGPSDEQSEPPAELRQWARGAAIEAVDSDRHDQIVAIHGQADQLLGVPAEHCLGVTLGVFGRQLKARRGPELTLESQGDGRMIRRLTYYRRGDGTALLVRSLVTPRRDDEGRLVGATTWAVARPSRDDGRAIPDGRFERTGRQADAFATAGPAGQPPISPAELARLGGWSAAEEPEGLACDLDDRVEQILGGRAEFLGLSAHECLGRTLEELSQPLGQRWGRQLALWEFDLPGESLRRVVRLHTPGWPATLIYTLVLPRRDPEGRLIGTETWAVARPETRPPDADV